MLAEHTTELAAKLETNFVLVCQSGVRGGNTVEGPKRWSIERQVRMAAESLVVAGLAGGRFLSPQLRALPAVIGAGLTFSAATNTCAMGNALSKMPWNRTLNEPTRESIIAQLPASKV